MKQYPERFPPRRASAEHIAAAGWAGNKKAPQELCGAFYFSASLQGGRFKDKSADDSDRRFGESLTGFNGT